ncbi:MAG: DNA helicase, partial [Gammaproteobacteria bacterium]|nr:DNA helicase [Gammaproteobacteria bacterium]
MISEIVDNEADKRSITISIIAASKVNLALQQNSVPVLRDIVLNNPTDVSYQDLELTVTTSPGFAKPKAWHITRLAPDTEFSLHDRMIELNPGFLEEVNEAVRGTYNFSLNSRDKVLATASCDVQVLSRNEWGGIQELPEILAAYVQPNSPFIQEILRTAAKVLQGIGHAPKLDGYQSRNRKKVGEMVNAIWSAVVRQDLAYAEPPASFENTGQKIRLPEEVKRYRLVTCMDSTLLFAGALEQAGFNSLVIFTKGHSFVGVWLEDLEFGTSVVEDLQALRKRVDLKEILVFETTYVAHRPAISFNQAREEANGKLFDEDSFLLLVDI